MGLTLARLADNHLAGLTPSTSATAFERGFPAAHLTTTDAREVARLRGSWLVVASLWDRLDWTRSGAKVATLAPGWYHGWPALAAEIESKMNAADAGAGDYVAVLRQTAAAGYRWAVKRTGGGTFTWDVGTGPNASRSAARGLLGYRAQDRSAAAEHVGDFAAVCGPYQSIAYDLGSAKPVRVFAVLNPRLSPGGVVQLGLGDAAAATDETVDLGGAPDDEIMLAVLDEPLSYRYAEIRVGDARRTDGARAALGGAYLMPALCTDDPGHFDRLNWEVGTFAAGSDIRRFDHRSKARGDWHITEVPVRGHLTIAFRSAPGLDSSVREQIAPWLRALGTEGLVLLAANPEGEPQRDSIIGRVVEMGDWQRDENGRWQLDVRVERLAVR